MTRSAPAITLTAILTAGCATAPPEAKWVDVRPLQVGGAGPVSAADRYYPGAVAAIERRDYAAALELLQLARAQAPTDVRVFNAFGVIYDKLGRFDLSARYYAQAAALEPSSPIVAANVAYSAVLERRLEQPIDVVRLARAEGDVRRMAQPDFTPDLAPVVHRIIEGASTMTVASAPAIRIDATRAQFASASPRAMRAAEISDSPPAPLAPVVSSAPRLIMASDGPPVRVDAARPRLASAAPPRPMAQPTISEAAKPELAPVVSSALRPITASSSPVRIDAARPRLASAAPRPMTQPAISEAAPLAPVVSSAPKLITASGAPARVEAARTRLAAASPKPMSQPSFAAPASAAGPAARLPLATAAAASQPAQATTARHVLYPIVRAAEPQLVAGGPVRVDAAARPAGASPRVMAQPAFAAASEAPSSAGPPVRLPLLSAAAPPARVQSARPPVVRLAAAPKASGVMRLAQSTAPRRLPLLTGSTLLVINASGRKAGGDPVVTRLAHLGWSMPRSSRIVPAQARTAIVYPARNAAVAQALAKTLPYKVRLVNCGSSCKRMALVVGADALAWRKGARAGSMVKAKIA